MFKFFDLLWDAGMTTSQVGKNEDSRKSQKLAPVHVTTGHTVI